MRAIGFRCWGDKIAWVVLNGTVNAPRLIAHGHANVPANSARAQQLAWLRREVANVARSHQVGRAYYRDVEGMSRGAATAPRYECHGVLQEAWFSERPTLPLEKRVMNQIKRDTGLTGGSEQIGDLVFDHEELCALPAVYRDAIAVALCGLEH
jgi:hypothetical protein